MDKTETELADPGQGLLLSLLVRKDKEAFDLFFRQYYPRAVRFASVICKDEQAAKDISMDVFMDLWNSPSYFASVRNLDSYFFVILKNRVIQYLRHDLGSMPIDELTNQIRDLHDIEENAICDQLKSMVDEIIDSMPSRQREVFVMRVKDGLTNRQIADRLGISIKTVEVHMRNAVAAVRKVVLLFFTTFLMNL